MDNSRNSCMSIHAIVDNDHHLPLSPPTSYKSHSPSPLMGCKSSPLSSRGSIDSQKSNFHSPMSSEEKKYRNKLASAKYRAKKQENIKSMSGKISKLMSSNLSLQKELEKVNQENRVLRAMLLSYQSSASSY